MKFEYHKSVNLRRKKMQWPVKRVENVGEEDCIKIKTEEDYIEFVGTIKTE
jgi:hypothetical protein